jgi:hypothetical protein
LWIILNQFEVDGRYNHQDMEVESKQTKDDSFRNQKKRGGKRRSLESQV